MPKTPEELKAKYKRELAEAGELKRNGATCMLSVSDDPEHLWEATCDKPATTTRAVDGIFFELCAAHAKQLDEEDAWVEA